MDSEPRTPVRDLVAAIDQAGGALRDVARILGDYRRELEAAGLDRDEAIELLLDVQRDILFCDLAEDE